VAGICNSVGGGVTASRSFRLSANSLIAHCSQR